METTAPDSVTRIQSALYRLTKTLVFRDQPPAELAELPLSQLRCVRVVGEHEGEKMLELAHHLCVTLPALSQIVDRLVRRNMLERRADEEDRRIVRVFLSDSARNVLAKGHEERRERIARSVALLSTMEAETTVGALERLADCAEQTGDEIDEIHVKEAALAGDDMHGAVPADRLRSVAVSPKAVKAGQ